MKDLHHEERGSSTRMQTRSKIRRFLVRTNIAFATLAKERDI
jgi:hypothetical protein